MSRSDHAAMLYIRPLKLCALIVAGCVCCFARADADEQVVEVPFALYRNEVIVQVKDTGRGRFRMRLDTRTDPSVVDMSRDAEMRLKLDRVGRRGTGGGTEVNLAYAT